MFLMSKVSFSRLALVSVIFTAIRLCPAQAQQGPPITSPDVGKDGRVTFRFHDPSAQAVLLHVDAFKDPFTMQKQSDGTWSFTSEALSPDLYGYWFEADGVHVLDPLNTAIKPNLLSLTNVVHVPGATPLPWETSDVLHGTVHHHFYHSAIVGDDRDFYVYTPPRYNPAEATKYPVLYLLHGYSDDASGWTAVGKANLILDNLIAQGQAKPMIVVMPLGYGAPEIVQRAPASSAGFNNTELRERNFDRFRQTLIDEVIPEVERTYRVNGDVGARAIAGLSMGGAESLLTGLNRLDKFSYIGAFSAGGLGSDYDLAFPQLQSSANGRIHLLWIACGTEDRLITPNRQTIAWLKGKGIQLTPVETPGMHTWLVWRRNLAAFAPLLFRAGETSSSSGEVTSSK
jgi:enterochelin esterase-like enzyme